MASETIIRLVDDLDGGDATETIKFALDGTAYELDLNAKNAAVLRKALEKYVAAARSTGAASKPRASTGRSPRRSKSDVDPKVVRAWAAQNKVEINSRGRIPDAILGQFRAATGG